MCSYAFCTKFFQFRYLCLCCLSSVTRSAETVRPPTPPSVRASTPEHPNPSPAAPEVVQPIATATAIEAAKVTSVATDGVGTSGAKPAPWSEHVSAFCRVRVWDLVMYNLCLFHVLAALLSQPGVYSQSCYPDGTGEGWSAC